MKRIKLTREHVLEIHDTIDREDLHALGTVYDANLDHIVSKINAEKDIFRQASVALYEFATNQVFWDGNKRTAFLVSNYILGEIGYELLGNDDMINFLLEVAQKKIAQEAVDGWIRNRANEI